MYTGEDEFGNRIFEYLPSDITPVQLCLHNLKELVLLLDSMTESVINWIRDGLVAPELVHLNIRLIDIEVPLDCENKPKLHKLTLFLGDPLHGPFYNSLLGKLSQITWLDCTFFTTFGKQVDKAVLEIASHLPNLEEFYVNCGPIMTGCSITTIEQLNHPTLKKYSLKMLPFM